MRSIVLAGLLAALPAAAQTVGDAAGGQRVFNQCRACHTVDQGGRNGVGPNLHGVFGRRAGALEGFRFSAPMRARGEAGMVWDEATLLPYEATLLPYMENPREVVPGTNMAFAGLRQEQQRHDLIAYLRQATGAAQ